MGTWQQLADLLAAFLLSSLIGLEREYRQKSAGLRTYALIGLSAALFMLISKYGFNDIILQEKIVLDPSRVAAQIVSGIGFIGGGVIFMRRNIVRGLTTAASVWLTAALGMACGAGMLELAIATALAHFIIMFIFPFLSRRLPRARRDPVRLEISYVDGMGILQKILVSCTRLRFTIDQVRINQSGNYEDSLEIARDQADWEGHALPDEHRNAPASHATTLLMIVKGKRPASHLIAALSTIEGVRSVGTLDDDDLD